MRVARTLVAAAVVACAGGPAVAATAAGDPLHAPECRHALDALQAAEAGASAPSDRSGPGGAAASGATRRMVAVDPRLAAARRDVARRCLAARADPPRAGRLAEPPLAVPSVAATHAPSPPAASGTTTAQRIAPVQPPVAITSCDAGGCWTSDGARLQRLGPTLWGPRGACSVVGAVVECP